MYSQQMLALLELSNRDKLDVIKTLWGLYPSFVYLKKKWRLTFFMLELLADCCSVVIGRHLWLLKAQKYKEDEACGIANVYMAC